MPQTRRGHDLRRWSACAASAAAVALAPPGAASGDLAWTFTDSDQGWIITDLDCGGPYVTPVSSESVVWSPSGGDPGGYVLGLDPAGNCYFFSAPEDQLGDLSRFLGGTLSFSLRSTLRTWPNDNVVVLVSPSGSSMVAEVAPLPDPTWTRYSILLRAEVFRMGSKLGPVPTEAEFAAMLANVRSLRISAEYGALVAETTSLDSVRFAEGCPCPLDYDSSGSNIPDLDDLLMFFADFNAGSPRADVTCTGPGSVPDIDDLVRFFEAFSGGC